MTDTKEEIKEEIKNVADNLAHPDHETDKEAKKRQPWMPIAGSLVVGVILVAIALFFFQ